MLDFFKNLEGNFKGLGVIEPITIQLDFDNKELKAAPNTDYIKFSGLKSGEQDKRTRAENARNRHELAVNIIKSPNPYQYVEDNIVTLIPSCVCDNMLAFIYHLQEEGRENNLTGLAAFLNYVVNDVLRYNLGFRYESEVKIVIENPKPSINLTQQFGNLSIPEQSDRYSSINNAQTNNPFISNYPPQQNQCFVTLEPGTYFQVSPGKVFDVTRGAYVNNPLTSQSNITPPFPTPTNNLNVNEYNTPSGAYFNPYSGVPARYPSDINYAVGTYSIIPQMQSNIENVSQPHGAQYNLRSFLNDTSQALPQTSTHLSSNVPPQNQNQPSNANDSVKQLNQWFMAQGRGNNNYR